MENGSEGQKEIVPEGGFRCPFEVQGIKEDTIMEAPLTEDKNERLQTVRKALEAFHQDPKSPGLKFTLPDTFRDSVHSSKELKQAILPYQTDILAAELDYRLYPFFSYQLQGMEREAARVLLQKTPYKLHAAYEFENIIKQFNLPPLKSSADISDWIKNIMKDAFEKGINNPTLKINGQFGDQVVNLLSIAPEGIILHPEQEMKIDPQNQNCFSIVKSPFYPEKFGRYSEHVEIILSRETDFNALSKTARQKIRHASNTVLKEHGVEIMDLSEDKQHGGVWIPENEEWL